MFIGITIRVFLDIDALASCRLVVAVLLVIWAPLPLLFVVGLWLVLVLFGRFLGHPSWELVFITFFALLVLAFVVIALALVVIVGPPFLLELFDGSFQGHDLLKLWGGGIPGLCLE